MWIKITNCAIINSKGKIRKNQNIHIDVRNDTFFKITKKDFIKNLMYNYNYLNQNESFRTTLSSKVILPKEYLTFEQKFLLERKLKIKTLLNKNQ